MLYFYNNYFKKSSFEPSKRAYANKKDYEVPQLTQKQLATFEKYNKVDIELYNFFNASLHEKIDAFGRVV